MNSNSRIPVFILTGFLGSGKTTLLNKLLKRPGFTNTAIVINEFGEIGLDHLLVTSARENIVLLDAGCLCCTVLGSLRETLTDLYQQRSQGLIPPFERLIIETSGLADPGPILQLMMRNTLTSRFYQLAGLLCVVDSAFGLESMDQNPEAREQVALADRILVSKTDLAIGNFSDRLLERLRSLNPTADIQQGLKSDVDSVFLADSGGYFENPPWAGRLSPVSANGYHQHNVHDLTISSESFWIDHFSTWAGIASWIDVMRRRYGANLLRCKGLIGIQGAPGPVIVHGVKTLFDTSQLPAWPDGDQRSRLVVIGKGIDRAEIRASLAWLLAPEGTQPPYDPTTTPPVWTAA